MKSTLIVALAGAAAAKTFADAPAGSSIRNIALRGTGCPAGSTNYQFDADGALTIYTPQMNAAMGPGVSVESQRAACTLLADILAPTGWQFALSHAQVRGRANLEAGAVAAQGGRVSFAGQNGIESFSTPFNGPMQRPYVLDYNENDRSSAVWSPCGSEGLFTINFNANVQSGAGNLTIERTKFYTTWRQCSA